MKKIKLHPLKKELDAIIKIAGSKSYTNRALIIASLARGKSILRNPLYSDDTKYMMESLEKLGVCFEKYEDKIVVQGCGGKFGKIKSTELFCGLAGTTSRFLTGLASLVGKEIIVNGSGKLLERPISDLVCGLRQIGVKIDYLGKKGSLPLKIDGKKISGGKISIKGNVSSQFLTSILMIAPLLQNDLKIDIIGLQVSKSYIDITIDIMKKFGVKVINNNYKNYIVKAGQEYIAKDYIIEGDWSSASYFCCIGALHKGQIEIQNLNNNSVQGDRVFAKLIEMAGVEVVYKDNSLIVRGGNPIKPLSVDMKQMPDTAMSMAVLLSFADGISKITGLKTLKFKETDRLTAMHNELNKLGIENIIGDNYIEIHGIDNLYNIKKKIEIETYDDHRIAMSFAIAGSRIKGIIIKNPNVVSKSFVSFWSVLKQIGIKIDDIQ